jgi:hypothetical protein
MTALLKLRRIVVVLTAGIFAILAAVHCWGEIRHIPGEDDITSWQTDLIFYLIIIAPLWLTCAAFVIAIELRLIDWCAWWRQRQ